MDVTTPISSTRSVMPASFLSALAIGAGFMGFAAWDQSHWWLTKDDYSFGWLAPVFAGLVIYDRWPRLVAAVRSNAVDEGQTPDHAWRSVWWMLLALGAGVFLFGAVYRAGAGPSYPASLAIALGTAAMVLGSSAVSAGANAGAPPRVAALMLFPACVWLISAPLVSAIENVVSVFLLNQVMGVVFFVFEVLGMPLEQQGNVLVLPTGQVGVAEACSGIRSLLACVFAGAFLAAMFLDRGWKKLVLIVASVMLAFAGNLLRSLFLTGWAYRHGPASIEGRVHDLAGYAVIPFAVVGLLGLVALLKLKVSLANAPKLDRARSSAPGPRVN